MSTIADEDKIIWANGPSGNTPLSAANLNKVNEKTTAAIETLENSIDTLTNNLEAKSYIKNGTASRVECNINSVDVVGKDLKVANNIETATGMRVFTDHISSKNNANEIVNGKIKNATSADEAAKLANIETHVGLNVGTQEKPVYFMNGIPQEVSGKILLQDSCDNMNKIGTLLSSHSSDKFLSLTLSFIGDVPAYQYAQTMGDSSATVDTGYVLFKANTPYTFYFTHLNTVSNLYYFTGREGSTLGFRAGSSSSTDPVKATYHGTDSVAVTNPSNKIRFFYTGANFVTSGSYSMGTTVDRSGTFILTYTK